MKVLVFESVDEAMAEKFHTSIAYLKQLNGARKIEAGKEIVVPNVSGTSAAVGRVTEGTKLRKGQVIAYVGNSDNASPDAPHLHFAVFKLEAQKHWWRGSPVNPFLLWRDEKS
jgi:hypothetical protein